MKMHSLLFMGVQVALYIYHVNAAVNERPIIGIISEDVTPGEVHLGDSNIYATYVKYVEEAGARVVPIKIHQPDEYYTELFQHINGVLMPGGGVSLSKSGFGQAAHKLYRLAVQANDAGVHFPLWGTCLGFQELVTDTGGPNLMTHCDAENLTLPLELAPGFEKSRLLKDLPSDLAESVQHDDITQNNHQYCVTPKTFKNSPALTNMYNMLAYNHDRKGMKFVSVMEGIKYPFYGTQWHPEKASYTWDLNQLVNHSVEAVRLSQYMANFFVNEARKNGHKYECERKASSYLIYNYSPVYRGYPTFQQVYYFRSHDDGQYLVGDYQYTIQGSTVFIFACLCLLPYLYILMKHPPCWRSRRNLSPNDIRSAEQVLVVELMSEDSSESRNESQPSPPPEYKEVVSDSET